MAKQKFTVWLHKNLEGEPNAGKVWIGQSNLAGRQCFEGCISLGSVEIEIDVPDVDTRAVAIDTLEQQIQQVMENHAQRINVLNERISKMRAIAHEGE